MPLYYEWTKKVSKGTAERQKQSLERIVESLTNSLDADELEVLKALHMSDFAKLSWLMRPLPNLEGLTPVEVLKQGGIDKLTSPTA